MLLRTLLVTAALLAGVNAHAAGGGAHFEKQEWSFQGLRGDWDQNQIFRGYKVATQVCLACHSFKYVSHRNFTRLGWTEDQAKALAAELNLTLDQKLISALSPEDAKETYGKEMPDLSVMNKARAGGADYVFALLTHYVPEDEIPEHIKATMLPGTHHNPIFLGGIIAMPKPLNDGQVEYPEGAPEATVEQMARDVAAFMAWTAEPERVDRQNLGVYVLLYLVIFAGLSYMVMKRIWRNVKK